MDRLVIVVTGANAGVGFGVCQRLISQLSSPNPQDARSQNFEQPTPPLALTLIMACRNLTRASLARQHLLTWLDSCVTSASPADRPHALRFRESCVIKVAELDLASVDSVKKFARGLPALTPYVTHLICNAGVASFKSIDWSLLAVQILSGPMSVITRPTFYSQHVGERSPDGLGWVWQSNVFGHYLLFRLLTPLLTSTPLPAARVIWCSSLEASPAFYDPQDWQLVRTEHSYESSKYQIDLVAHTLDREASAVQKRDDKGKNKPIRHFVGEPGVCSTAISQALVGPILDWFKVVLFYVGRLLGSPHHTISPFKAAIASTHLALAPLILLPTLLMSDPDRPVKFGAQTGRWGGEYVGRTQVRGWEEKEGQGLVEKFEGLVGELAGEEGI